MPELERTKEGEEVDAGGEVNREPGMGSAEKDGSLEPAAGGRRVGLGWGESRSGFWKTTLLHFSARTETSSRGSPPRSPAPAKETLHVRGRCIAFVFIITAQYTFKNRLE